MRAIGYKRVSTEKQVNEGQGLEVQEKSIKKYCKTNNIELVQIFSDEGISGAEDIDKRVGLGEALTFIRENKIDYIIITKQDRLARDTELYYWLAREIKILNCQIVSTDQRIEENPTGKLLETMMVAFASFEKQLINLRMKSGKKNKIDKRQYSGGEPPLGYRSTKISLEIEEEEALIIKHIFSSRIKGKTSRAISQEIAEIFDKRVPHSSVAYILKNRAYMGILSQEKNKTIEIPAIISKNMFYRANQVNNRKVAQN